MLRSCKGLRGGGVGGAAVDGTFEIRGYLRENITRKTSFIRDFASISLVLITCFFFFTEEIPEDILAAIQPKKSN